jgi:nucleoside-diphosphate-sugar epimerase
MLPEPEFIADIEQLEDLLSTPDEAVIEVLGALYGDLVVLGAGGKMGPTLARMARRAFDAAGVARRVIAVSRFSKPGTEDALRAHGIETLRCDLLDPEQVATLPQAPLVVYMTGLKFGTSENAGRTWAMNTYAPANAFRHYRHSRIAAFSSGNIYGMTPVSSGGSKECDSLKPDGEYAMSCLGRERMFDYFSRAYATPTSIIRLNYACELRYGVLVDLANWIWAGKPVPLAVGHLNAIWQRDANAVTLRSLAEASSPPFVLNVAGPETLRVHDVAETLGRLLDRPVTFEEEEADAAFLSDAAEMVARYGPPRTDTRRMLTWIAAWIKQGGAQHGLPTHFEVTSGDY